MYNRGFCQRGDAEPTMMSTFTGTREQARPRMMGRHPGQVSYPSKEYVMCVNEGVKASAVSSLSGGLPIMRER